MFASKKWSFVNCTCADLKKNTSSENTFTTTPLNRPFFKWSLVRRRRNTATELTVWVWVTHEPEQAGNIYLSHTQQHHSVYMSLSLSLSFLTQKKEKSWTERDVFSFREKLLMIPITIILMEIIIIISDGQNNSINFICFIKSPFYFVCLLHVNTCSDSIL